MTLPAPDTPTTTTQTAEAILNDIRRSLANVFSSIEWAEDEISQAQNRHPQHADTLYHSFSLLRPRESLEARMITEVVYRAHTRELLDRIAAGRDTRPATAVEIVIGLLEAATRGPLTHNGFALCARMWTAAGLPDVNQMTDKLTHYEALISSDLDTEEATARHVCRDDSRALGPIECDGLHHGSHVPCKYHESPAAA